MDENVAAVAVAIAVVMAAVVAAETAATKQAMIMMVLRLRSITQRPVASLRGGAAQRNRASVSTLAYISARRGLPTLELNLGATLEFM